MTLPKNEGRNAASFRDPSGFVFHRDGVLYRQVNLRYRVHYEALMSSGLYRTLVGQGALVSHEEVGIAPFDASAAFKVIRPAELPFISSPQEWTFGELKDAALLTLDIQRKALEHGMVLKDASAYNIQFSACKPLFIDTLSFEVWKEGSPWVAYRQFCEHFLAPLALMAKVDAQLGVLQQTFIDGIPLGLARSLLPWRTRFNPSLMIHVHLHAKSQERFGDRPTASRSSAMRRSALLGLTESLTAAISKLTLELPEKGWSAYYDTCTYSGDEFRRKAEFIGKIVRLAKPARVWDIGANTGAFSKIAAAEGIMTIAMDNDPLTMERLYRDCRSQHEARILPLVVDVANPTPGTGWENQERTPLLTRGPVDMVFALALIHHLAITRNIPLQSIARFFRQLCKHLVIEFVPKNDPQVQRLLRSREDIFDAYTREEFERVFGECFVFSEILPVTDSGRVLYWMTGKAQG